MRRDPRLEIITEALQKLIPGATPAFLTVEVTETLPGTGERKNTWSGRTEAVAERVFTALYGRPDTAEQLSPLAQAEDAKRRRDIEGEIGALMAASSALESAPWYPTRPGDLVHVHYEQAGDMPAFGETYIVSDAGDGLLGMQLLAHTLPETVPGLDAQTTADMAGVFTTEAADCPVYELWFEAGPHRLTIVRDGRPVHIGGAR
jgi:hypothetical protein